MTADRKIYSLPIASELKLNDWLYVVDVSDGQSKRIEAGNVISKPLCFQATNTDTTTDIDGAEVVIPWDVEQFKDAGFTHDVAVENGKITFDNAGKYLVYVNISFDAAGGLYRQNPWIQLKVNGVKVGGEALSGYIRQDSGHNEASNSFMRLIEVNAGDYLEVTGQQGAASGAMVMRANQSTLYIEKK